jgi:sporulation protein YlmC with PRC-barrel domain
MRRAGLPEIACLLSLLTAIPAFAPSACAQAPELRRIPAAAAATVLGRRVMDHTGDEIGRVVDVLVDETGRPVAALLDVGGYMGLGSRKVAVDWTRLRFTIAGADTRVIVDLDGNVIAAAPEYKGGSEDTPVLTGPAPKQ